MLARGGGDEGKVEDQRDKEVHPEMVGQSLKKASKGIKAEN